MVSHVTVKEKPFANFSIMCVSPLTLHTPQFLRKSSPHLYQGTEFSPNHIFAPIKSVH